MKNTSVTNSSTVEQRKLRAVMFADMVGYTAMMQDDEAGAKFLRTRQKRVLDSLIPAHNGNIIQYFGDGTLSLFDSSANAVRCAIAIQHELQKEPRVKLRIGIHSGDVVYDSEGIYGDCINIASRIETLSVPGAVLFSDKVNDEIKNQKDIKTKSVGKFHLKNIQHPIEVYAVANEGMVIPMLKEMHGKTEESFPFSSLIKRRSVRLVALFLPIFIITTFIAWPYIFPKKNSFDSIAVLPLENLSGDASQQYFVDGMHETLITELSKISALKVISRTSTIQYKNTKKTLRQVASELGVQALIEGSVIKDGNVVRITVQLINGKTDEHIWSKDFDRQVQNILALYSEVAQKIAEEVKIKLTPQDQQRLVSSSVVNPRAYEYYLTGRHYWNQRTIQGYKQAIESYEQALKQDSTYSLAYAAMAECYILLGEQGGMTQQEAGQLSYKVIQKALLLNNKLAEAYSSLGVWKLSYEWNWQESEKAFRQSINLNPGYASVYQWYGRTLGFIGRYDEADSLLQIAKDLDPLSPIIPAYIGQVYVYARQYKKAEQQLYGALKLHPNHPLILHNIGELLIAEGRYTEAILPLKQSAELSVSAHYKAILGYAYAKNNRKTEAQTILNNLLHPQSGFPISGFNVAALYLALGEKENALAQLEKGYEQKDVWMKELKAWPWFNDLKIEPRYIEIIRKMNFPQ